MKSFFCNSRSIPEVFSDILPEHIEQQFDQRETPAVHTATFRISLQSNSPGRVGEQSDRIPAQFSS